MLCRINSIRVVRIAEQANKTIEDKNQHLFIYAIVRDDLQMPTGKLAAQAGHAYTDSLMETLKINPDIVHKYMNRDNGGSKGALKANTLEDIMFAHEKCQMMNIPCALIIDENHILPPYFDGNPIVTALGIGPISRKDAKKIVGKFKCV